jgi:hypothetical protein
MKLLRIRVTRWLKAQDEGAEAQLPRSPATFASLMRQTWHESP